jgi:hypothetical protein
MTAARRSYLRAAAGALAAVLAAAAPARAQSGFVYNGMVHVSWWFDEYDSAQGATSRAALRATGTNWMGLLVTWYQDNAQSNVIARHFDPNKDHSDARIRTAIRDARSRGMRVMLKPHVDAHNGQWRGDFNPSNPDAWFQSYTQFITHYARIAQEEGAEGFVMGTEFKTLTTNHAHDARWTAVIGAVRAVYTGTLTYAANATFPADEFVGVAFWNQLDLIGLDAYFNLTDSSTPTVQQLIAAWTSNRFGENAVANVRNLFDSRGKPVIMTELGYKSTDRANVEPWNFGLSGPVDQGEQRDCYEAAFTVWSQQSTWMRGIFWWNWTVPPPPAGDGDYNPRNKLAEQVLRFWQGGSTGLTLTVTKAGTGTGTVTSNPAGINCGAGCGTQSASFASGTSVTLTAAAAGGSTFAGWSGACAGTTACTVSMTQARSVTATFNGTATNQTLTVNKAGTGTGTVTSSPAGISCGTGCSTQSASFANGTNVTLSAAPAGGSTFAGWSGACTGTGACTVSMTQARTVTATFNTGGGGGNGGVSVSTATGGSPPWYIENRLTLANTATVTAMTITVVVQRTPGITYNGMYNTVGSFQQASTGNSNAATITYTWTLSGTMAAGSGRLFVAQMNGTGTAHPATGDRWTATFTTGGQAFTQSGTF